MISPRKPTAGFWIVVGLCVLLVAYPLSFGPVCWLADREQFPIRTLRTIYFPVIRACSVERAIIRPSMRRWAELWGDEDGGHLLVLVWLDMRDMRRK